MSEICRVIVAVILVKQFLSLFKVINYSCVRILQTCSLYRLILEVAGTENDSELLLSRIICLAEALDEF